MNYLLTSLLILAVFSACKKSENAKLKAVSIENSISEKQAFLVEPTPCYKILEDGSESFEVSCFNLNSKNKIIDIYETTLKKFRAIEHTYTDTSWINKSLYLDVIDQLSELTKSTDYPIEPVEFNYDPDDPKERHDFSEETYIPLLSYYSLKEAEDKWQNYYEKNKNQIKEFHSGLDANNLRKILGSTLRAEYASVGGLFALGALVEKTTGTGKFNIFRIGSSDLVLRKVTESQEKNHSRLDKNISKWKIAKFSGGVGINSYEIVAYYGPKNNGDRRFVYRGPKYLFGRSVPEYVSINDWFIRDFTPEAREDYLRDVNRREAALVERYPKHIPVNAEGKNIASQVVISPADSRVRFENLYAGRVGILQHLTGKIVSKEAQIEALSNLDDNPYNYTRKYSFNLKELLGRANTNSGSMGVRMIPYDPKTKILDNDIFRSAQHEVLSAIYRELSRSGAVQLVERLAPADVHNYVAPVNGKALSLKEASDFFKKRAKKWHAYYSSLGDKGRAAQLEKEYKHYDSMISVFKRQEEIIGRPSQSTIDIYGTNISVSAWAIKNRSNILAQNDRKVMVFLHDDPDPEALRFSIHVFIGATGVNKVDVDPRTAPLLQGARVGDMQFGGDNYSEDKPFKATGEKGTRDGYAKLRVGEKLGKFPPDGSTIISYYPMPLFTVLPNIQRFRRWGFYKDARFGNRPMKIELKTQVGNPLLMSTDVIGVEILRNAGIDYSNATSFAEALTMFIESQDDQNSIECRIIQNIRSLAFQEHLNPNEAQVKKRLEALFDEIKND